MNTPTPGDLSARLLAYATRKAKARDALGVPAGDYVGQEEIDTLCQAAAALSALPAAGTPVAWQYRYKDRAAGTNIYNTFRHPVEEMGHGDEIEWWVYGVHTTPQPSAADDYESWAKQERQREDTATRLGSAAVGAQGDECFCDARGIGAPGVSCGDCPRDYAAPAAGKGVDDVSLADIHLAAQMLTWGRDEGLTEKQEAEVNAHAQKLFAALTRQPGSLEARLSQHTTLTRQPVAGDGMVLVPREPTLAMFRAMVEWALDASDPPPTDDYLRENMGDFLTGYRVMLAAAPAATPTDGGEGS